MDEAAIANAATVGGKRAWKIGKVTPAATGIPKQLYIKDHMKFHLILEKMTRLRSKAVQMSATLCPLTRTMSEASAAMAAPVPILIPTSAWASAGLSLMPVVEGKRFGVKV